MDWKEFLKPTVAKILIFLILLAIGFFLPLIPIKVQIMCFIAPCYPNIEFISMYQILFQNILTNHYLFASTATFIVPIIEIIVLYLIAVVAFEARKSKTFGILLILTGLAVFLSKFSCLTDHTQYSCRKVHLTLTIFIIGLFIAGYGIYRLYKISKSQP